MLNLLYSILLQDPISFYMGIGVGAVVGDLRAEAGGRSAESWDTTFGSQAMLGFRYSFASPWEIELGYKVLKTLEYDLGRDATLDGTLSHSVLGTITYRF
jgi:opacity protein-like surface antigen